MKYKIKVYSIWEYGQRIDSEGKPHQEDSIFPAFEQQKDSDRLFILCDGMGGHEAGEVASSTVCSAMSKSIFESAPDSEGDFSDDNLKKAIADAFDSLDALPIGDVSAEKKMGTTMTFLKFHNKGCTIAHMGDSRVYHIRPGKGRDDTRILFKTNDHSLVNDLIKVGELTPEEAKQSKQKNIITRAMQPKMERHPKPDIYHTVDIKPGDYFYMCSDGMLEQMEDENLLFNFSEATGDDDNKVKILTQATSQNLDNHSAIIIHVLDVIDSLPLDVIPTAPAPPSTKPEPIMAEVDEDSLVEKDDVKNDIAEKSIGTDIATMAQSTKIDPVTQNKDNTIHFNSMGIANQEKTPQKRNTKLGLYISFVILLVLLAVGLFIVSLKFSNHQDENPDKIENSQKPDKKPNKSHNVDNPTRTPSSQDSPNKPNETTTPDKPNSENQSESSNSGNSSVPAKIQNVVSSQANQSGNNSGEIGGTAPLHGSNGHSTTSIGVNLNHANQHGENVVSSDQQVAIDAVNNGNNKSKK